MAELMVIAGGILLMAAMFSIGRLIGGPHGMRIEKDGTIREF